MIQIREFSSTREAYAACQCDETIETGDTLLIPSEGVVGLADTWPVAVTTASGDLHVVAEGMTIRDPSLGYDLDAIAQAEALAIDLGFELGQQLTKQTETDEDIDDITLVADEDISVPSKLVSITMASMHDDETLELSDDHLEDIKQVFHGQVIAFAPTIYGLGIAVEDTAGYWPVPTDWYGNENYQQNAEYADQLNVHGLGLEEIQASKIVLSSMRAQEVSQ